MLVTKQLTVAFYSVEKNTMEVNGYSQLSGNQHSSTYLLLCSTKEKTWSHFLTMTFASISPNLLLVVSKVVVKFRYGVD